MCIEYKKFVSIMINSPLFKVRYTWAELGWIYILLIAGLTLYDTSFYTDTLMWATQLVNIWNHAVAQWYDMSEGLNMFNKMSNDYVAGSESTC